MNVADYVVTHEEIKPQRHKEHREKKEDIHEFDSSHDGLADRGSNNLFFSVSFVSLWFNFETTLAKR